MATLVGIRELFVKRSGRSDLTSADYATDSGADFFINSGQRALDIAIQQNQQSPAMYEEVLAADAYTVKFLYLRAVKQVWFIDDDDELVELDYMHFDTLMDEYPKLGSTDSGTPVNWANNILRRDPANEGDGENSKYHGVIIMPPPDVETTIRAFGLFHQHELEGNTDESYWSVNYPDLLVLAALRSLEGFYRNTQGYNDYDRQINDILTGIDNDAVESMLAGDIEMGG